MTDDLLAEFQRTALRTWPNDRQKAIDLYDALVAAQHRAEAGRK